MLAFLRSPPVAAASPSGALAEHPRFGATAVLWRTYHRAALLLIHSMQRDHALLTNAVPEIQEKCPLGLTAIT